ncbi:MAG: aquaporin [Candidatus Saccharimonadales bacterium]|jgi:glycerol uptake facilitator-like aquaporin
MATKAKTTSRAKAAKTTRPATTKAARTTKKPVVKSAPVVAARPATQPKSYRLASDLSGAQVITETIGTFLFVSAVIASSGNPLVIAAALAGLIAAMFSISGSHFNPAITFGLWTMRKISPTKMLFYWMAQFVGAILALFAVSAFSGVAPTLSLSSFISWDWRIVFAELVGMTIFMFAIVAAINRAPTDNSKAATISLGIFVALIVSTSFFQEAVNTENSKFTEAQQKSANSDVATPRLLKISGTTLNPAVAFSSTETESQSTTSGSQSSSTGASRLTLETLLGTFFGAALGGWLYTLLARYSNDS